MFRKYWPQGFELEAEKGKYEWWRAKLLIDSFNVACNNISASFLKVGGESMSAICFWTAEKGNLPHLYDIFRKPEPLSIEFKTFACSVTGALIFIEVYRGKLFRYGVKRDHYEKLIVIR